MKQFAVAIDIAAPAKIVWDTLTQGENWTRWNTTIDKLEGKIAKGEKIKVFAKISPGKAFPVTVAELSPPYRMVWKGGMPLGLFTGTRTFTLLPQPAGGVRFTMEEVFQGLMAPLICKSIPDLQPAFVEFATCLKKAAETEAAAAR